MKIIYESPVEVLGLLFRNSSLKRDEVKPDGIIDYGKDGDVVGMEIFILSKRRNIPRALDYAVMGQSKSKIRLRYHHFEETYGKKFSGAAFGRMV